MVEQEGNIGVRRPGQSGNWWQRSLSWFILERRKEAEDSGVALAGEGCFKGFRDVKAGFGFPVPSFKLSRQV